MVMVYCSLECFMSPLRGSEGWTSATQGLHPVLRYVTPSGFRVANMSIIAKKILENTGQRPDTMLIFLNDKLDG